MWDNEDQAFLDVVNQLKRVISPPASSSASAPVAGRAAFAAAPTTASHADIVKECKDLVAKGKPDKAIKKVLLISQEIDEDIHTQFIMLSGRLEALKKDSMMGTISESSANTTRSQITYALLQVLGDLQDEL